MAEVISMLSVCISFIVCSITLVEVGQLRSAHILRKLK